MPSFVFNISKGREVELFSRVQNNDPANSAIVAVVINTSTADAALQDLATLADVLADAGTAEVTNAGYARISLTDADITVSAPDNANDRRQLSIPQLTFAAVQAGDAWTDLILCYDPDTTVGTDADLVPISMHDLTVTPDGTDIVINSGVVLEAT